MPSAIPSLPPHRAPGSPHRGMRLLTRVSRRADGVRVITTNVWVHSRTLPRSQQRQLVLRFRWARQGRGGPPGSLLQVVALGRCLLSLRPPSLKVCTPPPATGGCRGHLLSTGQTVHGPPSPLMKQHTSLRRCPSSGHHREMVSVYP